MILLFSLLSLNLSGQLHINEICSSNRSSLTDSYGETPDWIELYNAGESTISLQNFYLTDDSLEFDKYQLPDFSLEAKSFVIIFASDRDETTDEIHTNFKLSSAGEGLFLSDLLGSSIDEIVFPELNVDHSFGKSEDGSGSWVIFDYPTPGETNSTSSPFVNMLAPGLSHKSGLYSDAFELRISSNPNNNIARYTTDGTYVNINSNVLENVTISETTNLRVAFFDEMGNKGNEKNVIYLFDNIHHLPVVHISAEDEKLFDDEIGIFERGPDAESDYPFYGSNFWKDIEVPISFTYFEDNKLQLEYKLGMKIHGGKASRTNPMHSLRLIADLEYGTNEMDYKFFPESTNTRFKRLVLRNASGDFNYTHFRDGYLARYFAKENLNLDLIQFRPAVVYINGEYYGLLFFREKIDKFYVEEHYGYTEDEIDLLEKDTLIVEGNFDLFNEHLDFLYSNDLSNDENFEIIKSNFDVDQYIDYFAAQSIVNNTDWPRNNIKYWRAKENGKWRYFLFDMDVSMGRHGWTTADQNYLGEWVDTLSNAKFYDIMLKLWENPTYKNEFITRYCDLLNSTFKVENWLEETVNTKENLEPEIIRQFERWSDNAYETWVDRRIPELYEFVELREDYARDFLRQRFDLSDAEKLNLKVEPPSAGFYNVNTIQVNEMPWEGFYFDEIESNLTANANPGFTFSHWEIKGNATSTEDINNLRIKDFSDLEIIAHFDGEFQGSEAILLPNPSSGLFNINFANNDNASVSFTIYDQLGKNVFSEETDVLFAGDNTISLNVSFLNAGVYFLEIDLGEYQETKKLIIHDD